MIDKTYADIKSILLNQGLLLNLFDILRIVDAKEGTIVELVDGELFTTKVSCNDVFIGGPVRWDSLAAKIRWKS